jgi:hypothetical protein
MLFVTYCLRYQLIRLSKVASLALVAWELLSRLMAVAGEDRQMLQVARTGGGAGTSSSALVGQSVLFGANGLGNDGGVSSSAAGGGAMGVGERLLELDRF